jgi:UDP-galactopyranose mutase
MPERAPPAESFHVPAGHREADPLLLCLSHLRWNFVFQRPQHLLTRAAAGWPVIFFEEPIRRADITVPRLDISNPDPHVVVAVPVLPEGMDHVAAMRAQRDLLDRLLADLAPRKLVAWFYTPMALGYAAHLAPDATVYDCMDELSAFRGAPPELVQFEKQLLGRADLVFTGGTSLYEGKRGRHPSVHCFPSSIDRAHFAPARGFLPEPADLAEVPRPRLGYFGVVDERMDLALLDEMAALRPQWSFVMVGPVVKIDPGALPRRANIHWLGQKAYKELPNYLAHWDIGLMNFALNESTRFISPTKTPEYLAAGLPVISTPIVDVVRGYGEAGHVEIVNDAEDAVTAAEMLLARPREPWLSRVDKHLAAMSWDQTWSGMKSLIENVLKDGARPSAAQEGVRAHA